MLSIVLCVLIKTDNHNNNLQGSYGWQWCSKSVMGMTGKEKPAGWFNSPRGMGMDLICENYTIAAVMMAIL